MKSKPKKRFATAALIIFTTAATVVASPISASANPAQGFVLGSWSDEGPLSQSQNNHNNVVAMWQQILWADGQLNWSDIDCWYGPVTAAATKRWKVAHSDWGVPLDTTSGIAGEGVFRVAAMRLFENGGVYTYINEDSTRAPLRFWQGADGIWSMSISGDIRRLSYTTANFNTCS